MKKILTITTALFTLLTALFPFTARAAEGDEEPIVILRTNAAKEGALGFGLTLGTASKTEYYEIDFGFGPEEVEVEPWSIVDGAIKGTYIACSPCEEVRIYGDPSQLSMFSAPGAYLTEIEMDRCTNLEVLELPHNELQKLDLTPFTKLYAIYLSDNPFTAATPVIIGTPKLDLQILEVDNILHFDQNFNLSDYPAMKVFDAYHNLDLYHCNPTGCPDLMSLTLDMTNVSSIDVSRNVNLISLNVADCRVTHLDVSKNVNLQRLLAGHYSGTINTGYHLEEITLTNNPALQILDLAGNNLTTIDISHLTNLQSLFLTRNELTSLDVSNNPNLVSLMLNHNNMDFATLPLPRQTWTEYWYQEKPLPIGSRVVAKGAEIDLSHRVLRQGTETTAKVYRLLYDGEPEEVAADAYTYADGKIRFNQIMTDSVYVQYHNDVLNEYDLQTTPFVVKESAEIGKPSRIVSFCVDPSWSSTVNVSIGLDGASGASPVKFMADLGDGNLKEFTATSADIPSSPNLTFSSQALGEGRTVDIYVPEGEVMTALAINGVPLSSIDITRATELRRLSLTSCSLAEVDLGYNRCLQTLDLSGNRLTNVNLKGVYGNYEKNVLHSVDASDNLLTEFYILSRGSIRNLNLSHNKLTEYELKDFDNIDVLDLSNNQIEGELNLAYLADAFSIDISFNNISSLKFDSFNRLETFNVSMNALTLETLPYMPEIAGYVYAPLQPLQLLANAPAVNISDQNRIIDGKGTTFTWKKASGEPLREGTDVICQEGATRFLDQTLGKVYCEMTNPAFPQLAGTNVYRTTEVNVVGAPTKVVASFRTLQDAENGEVVFAGSRNTALYIDWRGDGSEFTPYPVGTSYIAYPGQRTFAGAEVKVYTYEEPTDITVFSLYNMRLGSLDATPLTGLTSLSIGGASLQPDMMKLPQASLLELNLEGNGLTEFPYADRYPNLRMLNLNNNSLTSFDASPLNSLTSLYLSYNKLTEVSFNNPYLWELSLDFNQLETLDLSGAKALTQLSAANNRLESIDLRPVGRTITALSIVSNRFTFATLPVQARYPNLSVYFYGNQAPVLPTVSADGMVYDLSSQAEISGNLTTYIWFLGEVSYDSESGSLSGEELYAGEEYTLDDGVTTFLTSEFNDRVMCVMTNPLFPNAYLYTPLYKVGAPSGSIDGVEADMEATETAPVDVYNLQGVLVRSQVLPADALEGLPAGIYIVGGRKVLVR